MARDPAKVCVLLFTLVAADTQTSCSTPGLLQSVQKLIQDNIAQALDLAQDTATLQHLKQAGAAVGAAAAQNAAGS